MIVKQQHRLVVSNIISTSQVFPPVYILIFSLIFSSHPHLPCQPSPLCSSTYIPCCAATSRPMSHSAVSPALCDSRLDAIRPRTVGYPSGHTRSLSPTPRLTWGGRASSRARIQWEGGDDVLLSVIEASLAGAEQAGGRRFSTYSVR